MSTAPPKSSSLSAALKGSGVYARLKNSWVQDFYWKATNKGLIDQRSRQVGFYRDLLKGFRDGDLIFDIGANVGEKADIFLRLGARVVAVEPDIRAQEVLRAKFLKYRLSPKPVKIVGKAVSDSIAVATLLVDGPGSALNTLSRKWADALRESRESKGRFDTGLDALEFANMREVETTTIEELTAEHGRPFFVKIDVEGHEVSVLRGLRQPVPFLSFEVNLPEFRGEGLECLGLLRQIAPAGECNFTANCSSGLALEKWVDARQLMDVISKCQEACIEVFWRNPLPPQGPTAASNGH